MLNQRHLHSQGTMIGLEKEMRISRNNDKIAQSWKIAEINIRQWKIFSVFYKNTSIMHITIMAQYVFIHVQIYCIFQALGTL